MIKHIPMGWRWLLVLLIALSSALEANMAAGNDDALIGQKYEIVGELYAQRVAEDLNSRVVSFISLVPLQLTGPEIISRQLVPTGSILTIVEKAPKRLFAFLYPDRYIVRVNTIDAPAEIPIVIGLSRGIEGQSTALNPLIFKPLSDSSVLPATLTAISSRSPNQINMMRSCNALLLEKIVEGAAWVIGTA
jgi:hypothetical protein